MAEYINRSALIDCLCSELETISCEIADSVCDFAEGFGEAINVVELFERDTKDEVVPIVHAAHIIWKEREVRQDAYYNSGHTWDGESCYFLKHIHYNTKVPYCSHCGKRIDDRFMHFCPNCGAMIEREST